jgi:hypothetical protein
MAVKASTRRGSNTGPASQPATTRAIMPNAWRAANAAPAASSPKPTRSTR